MKKVRKICCRITPRRILGAIVVTASIVNLVIVATVLDVSASTIANTVTVTRTINPVTMTFFAPTATQGILPSITLRPTEERTHTPTLTATVTSTFTPTATSTPTSTSTASPTATMCTPWSWWPVYIVQAGDNLSHISNLTGASVYELMTANCLPDTRIYAGQRLYVPRLPVIATDTFTPPPNTPTDFRIVDILACNPPIDVSLSVYVYDPQGILSVIAQVFTQQNFLIGQIVMNADGSIYYGSDPISRQYTVLDIAYYNFVATDALQNVTVSQPFVSRTSSCNPAQSTITATFTPTITTTPVLLFR